MILISIILLILLKNKERNMSALLKSKKDMIDLEKITKNIETNYKPAIVELTSYEQEQENNAIISYEELLASRNNSDVNYDNEYKNNTDIGIKKVSFSNSKGESIGQTKIEVNLMNYEKEEAFLKALRQLQKDLAR
jgi:hypothetical protein